MEGYHFLSARERKDKGLFRESDGKFRCTFCEVYFARNRDCVIHEKNFHRIRRIYSCSECDKIFYAYEDLKTHSQAHVETNLSFRLIKSVFDGASEIFRKIIDEKDREKDIFSILTNSNFLSEIVNVSFHQLFKRRHMNFLITVTAVFGKFSDDGDVEEKITFATSSQSSNHTFTNSKKALNTEVRRKIRSIDDRLQDFTENGSGWTLIDLQFVDLTFTSITEMRGGCHFPYKRIRGTTNILSEDDFCAVYCILAFYFAKTIPEKSRQKASSYKKFWHMLNISDISFPIRPDELEQLENRKHEVPPFYFNIFIEENGEVYPYRLSEVVKDEKPEANFINLLLLQGEDAFTKEKKYHYILIENMEAFLRKKYDAQRNYSKTINCKFCFAGFRSKTRKDEHEKWCKGGRKTIIEFEKNTNKKIEFTKFWSTFPHLLCGFVDFESLLEKTENFGKEVCNHCEKKSLKSCEHSYTHLYHQHKAVSYTFVVVDRDNKVRHQNIYTGVDAAENFLKTLVQLQPYFSEILQSFQEMDFTEEDRLLFEQTKICHLCGGDFSELTIEKRGPKVRDHCHVTGRFIAAAHSICNLNRKEKSVLKIFAHNFAGYDSHLIIPHLNIEGVTDINVIPKSGEKFLAVFFNKFYGLLDSMAFLSGSLDTLISTLPKGHDFSILKQMSFVGENISLGRAKLDIFLEKWKFREYTYLFILKCRKYLLNEILIFN